MRTSVLVISQDRLVRGLLVETLREEGFDVEAAVDDAGARLIAAYSSPVAVVLDTDVICASAAGANGWPQLIACCAAFAVPVLTISAQRCPEELRLLDHLDALDKPFEPLDVPRRLLALLSASRYRAARHAS